MRAALIGLASVVLILFATGCGGKTKGTGGTDATVDDGGTEHDGGSTTPGPSRFNITSGGGTTSSAGHKARITIGAPQPYGRTSGSGRVITTGPRSSP